MRWLSRLALAVTLAGFLGALLVSTCHAQSEPTGVEGVVAMTYCDSLGQPAIWLSSRVDPMSRFGQEVLAHEMKHVEQIRRWPTCAEARAYYNASPLHVAALEVEAYCASLPVAVAGGFSRNQRYVDYIQKVQRSVPEDTVSIEWVIAEFKKDCLNLLPGYAGNND